MGTKLTCKEVTDAVTGYLEGWLGFVQRLRFELHLGVCLGCRNYLRQMKDTIRTLGALPAEPIPPEVQDKLLRRFRNWKTK